jgi:hypothetical protein
MMNEQMMAFIQTLPPEKQAQLMASLSQQAPQQPQQPVDPRMGLPGQNNPQQGIPGAFQDFQGQAGVIDDQQAQAEALRNTATPEGMRTQNAGFVASNPLAHIASTVGKIKGQYDARAALKEKKALSDTKTDLLEDFAAKQLMKQAQAKQLREGGEGSPVDYNPPMSA